MAAQIFMDPVDVLDYFSDFNFFIRPDPNPQSRVSGWDLFWVVHRSRQGEASALEQLANTFLYTLSRRAAEAFSSEQQRPIEFEEWFDAKLEQLLNLLLYNAIRGYRYVRSDCTLRSVLIEEPEEGVDLLDPVGPQLDWSALRTVVHRDDRTDWHGLVRAICSAETGVGRVAAFEVWINEHWKKFRAPSQTESGWERNGVRDQVILDCLARGIKRPQIGTELDRQRIAVTLPALRDRGFTTYEAAWADKQGRQVLQQVYSKLDRRIHPPVKSFFLAK
jgi:hypothetical protein